jgi:protein-S-isoprenylcysteine O-methyltransferase Ste14
VGDVGSFQHIIELISRRRVTASFVLSVFVLWLANPTPRSLTIGALVATIGEGIRLWAAGHLEKGREVTASGPYAFTRHPLYLGSAIIGAGMAVASANLVAASVVVVFLAISLGAAIRTEEAHLTEKFGHQYPAYRAGHTPMVARRFSLARAIRNREYRAVAGLVVVLALLAWKAWH